MILTYCKPTFIHDRIISQFTGNKLVCGSNIFASKFSVFITTIRKRLVCSNKFSNKEALANLAEFSRLGIKVGLQVYDLYYTWGITMSAKALEHSNSSLAPSYWMVFWLCCRSYLMQSYISGILLTSNRPSFILKSFSNLAQRRINSSHDSPWYSFRSEMSTFSSQFCFYFSSLHNSVES